MIVLTAKINLLSNGSGSIEKIDCNIENNNVSSKINEIVTDTINGSNIFILGASRLGDGSTYANNVKSFVGSVTANVDGYFVTAYEIEITGKSINTFTIVFDTKNLRHPNTINVDGTDYVCDSPFFTVTGLQEIDKHTVIISNWNAPTYGLVIQAIYSELNIVINSRNMLSMTRTLMERADNEKPSWGIISNSGNIEFKELDEEIQAYIQDEVITQGLSCQIFMKDTLSGVEEQVAQFYTDTWDYNAEDKVISVSLKDDLEEWQDIKVEAITIDPSKNTVQSGSYFYNYLWNITTDKKYDMLSIENLDNKTRDILTNSKISYPLLNAGTLWQLWTKLCEALLLCIYKDSNGIIRCEYVGGE